MKQGLYTICSNSAVFAAGGPVRPGSVPSCHDQARHAGSPDAVASPRFCVEGLDLSCMSCKICIVGAVSRHYLRSGHVTIVSEHSVEQLWNACDLSTHMKHVRPNL